MNPLQIPALGRSVTLGTLYDARTQQFRDYVFNKTIDDKFITSCQTPYTFTEIDLAHTIYEKYRIFDLDAEATASILFGLIEITKSAKILTEETRTGRQGQGIMVHKTRTVFDSLQVYFDGLKESFIEKFLNPQHATHLVTGIQWGANVAISFTDSFQESHSRVEIGGDLADIMGNLKDVFSVSGFEKAKGQDTDLGFSVKIHKDITLQNEFPKTFKEIQDLVKSIPGSIAKNHGGKGIELEYTLTPVKDLADFLDIKTEQDIVFKKLDQSYDHKIIQLFEDISKTEQHLYDLEKDFYSYSICTLPETRDKLTDLQNEFRRSKIKLQEEARKTAEGIRAGKLNETKICDVFENYAKDEFNPVKVEKKLDEFKEAIDKINLYKMLRDSYPNVEYMGGRQASLKNYIFGKSKPIYIMYMKPEFIRNNFNTWQTNSNVFFSVLNQPFHELILVDCDFNSEENASIIQTTIKQSFEGKITFEDVVSELNLRSKSLDELEIKALGRFAELGEFYNARTDTFLGQNALISGCSTPTLIRRRDTEETNIISFESFGEKCKILGVDREQQVSVLAELFDLRRSGRYLEDNNDGDGVRVKSVIYSQLTEEETIDIQDSKFSSSSLNVPEIMKTEATHFVSSIQFGCNTIFSIKAPRNVTNAKEYLDCNARYLRRALIRSGSVSLPDFGSSNKEEVKEIKLKMVRRIGEQDMEELDPNIEILVFSDIQSEGRDPEVLNGVSDLILFFNTTLIPEQAYYSKGKPVSYVLSPIENLSISHGILKKGIHFQLITKPTNQATSNNVPNHDGFSLVQNIAKASRRISRLYTALESNSNSNLGTDKDFQDLKKIRAEFKSSLEKSSQEFRDLIIKLKSSEEGAEVEQLEFRRKCNVANDFGEDGRYLKLDKMLALESKLNLWNLDQTSELNSGFVRTDVKEILEILTRKLDIAEKNYENLEAQFQNLRT